MLDAELCNAGRYERTEVSRHGRAAIGASYLADKGTDLRTMQDYLSYRDKAHGALAAPLGIGSRGCGGSRSAKRASVIKANVERGGAVGQPADRDQVDAGGSDGPHRRRRDPA